MSQYPWPPVTTSSGPVEFLKNGVVTTVSEDTVTPANSNPLPVSLVDGLGLGYDENYGTVGPETLRTAAQVGNATGAASYGAGATGAQTLRVEANQGAANATPWSVAPSKDKITGTNSVSSMVDVMPATVVAGYSAISVQMDFSAATGSVMFYGSNDGVLWQPVEMGYMNVGVPTNIASTSNIFYTPVDFEQFKVTVTNYVNGNIKATWVVSNGTVGDPNLRSVSIGGSLAPITVELLDGIGNPISSTAGALDVNLKTPAPLPVNGTVTANQGTANATPWNVNNSQWGGTSTTLGQKVMASSVPVVIASDQSTLPISDSSLDTYVTGAGPATAIINTNILLAVTGTAATDLQGARSIAFQVVTGASTTAVAVNFEASNDNVNFVSIGMYDKTTPTAAPVITFTTAASTNRFFEGPTEFRYFRVRLVAAIVAGTVQAFSIQRRTTYDATNLSLAAGTQTIGALTANQSVNNTQINGVALLAGNGVTGTGSQRVTIASDNTAIPTKSPVNINGSVVNTTLTGTTASSNTAPTNAVGFILEAESTNTNNIRWAIGSVASATVGSLMEPGRDTGYVPCGFTISVCATVSGTNVFSIQWILSA